MKLEQSFEVDAPLRAGMEDADRRRARRSLPAGCRGDRSQRRRQLQRDVHREDRADHRLLQRQARDGERRRGLPYRDHAGPGHRQARSGRRQGHDLLAAGAGRRPRHPGRGGHRLPHHRPTGALRARRDDRGHFCSACCASSPSACRAHWSPSRTRSCRSRPRPRRRWRPAAAVAPEAAVGARGGGRGEAAVAPEGAATESAAPEAPVSPPPPPETITPPRPWGEPSEPVATPEPTGPASGPSAGRAGRAPGSGRRAGGRGPEPPAPPPPPEPRPATGGDPAAGTLDGRRASAARASARPSEPIQGLSLVGGVLWSRVKRNPAPGRRGRRGRGAAAGAPPAPAALTAGTCDV